MPHIDDRHTRRANLSYVKASMREPLLSRQEEMGLATRWRENHDVSALHRLVRAYTRLVVATASRFRNYGLPLGDLLQEGNVGLMMAAARFEPERDVRFSTYASWWIRSAIQDYVLRNWSIVRTGTTAAQKSLFFNLRRLRAKLPDAPDGGMTMDARSQVADSLGVNLSDVEIMEQRLSGQDQSLNAPVSGESENAWLDFLSDDRPNPESLTVDSHDGQTRHRWLQEAMRDLSDREQMIIRKRRLTEKGETLEQLGQKLGVSKERVRQLEHRALGKLRTAILKRTNNPRDLLIEGH
ncbi:RNA polymerase factor sigma-32 [Aestuariispira ectoiniformans]|uniref:RNA polymerase factor sigma-32 n=1 Tax=Aestuariispira ectoiniformans TaxID=2775080 RepID=UPI00223A853B|nr:RNA polymerase factor sigma-32 [Aestuariispira ectoiniformans]